MQRLQDLVERLGNRLPDPLSLFCLLGVIVLGLSAVGAGAGWTVLHPGTGETITVVNLLSNEGLRRILTEAVRNFTTFPPLGAVLTMVIGVGVCEQSGLIGAVLRRFIAGASPRTLTAVILFAGIMSSMAADSGYVLLVPLAARLWAQAGRHPLAGIATVFAGIGGGFSANLLITSLDPLLAGLSTQAAQLLEPNRVVQPTANWFFMAFSTFFLTVIGVWVNRRAVEPYLGPWTGGVAALSPEPPPGPLAPVLWAVIGWGVVVAALVVPEGAVLRGADGSFKPLFDAMIPLLSSLFLLSGIVYGYSAKAIRSDRDVAHMTASAMASMGSYVVLAFVIGQFVAWFNWSNLGLVLAVTGADALTSIGLVGAPLMAGFIVLSAGIDLLVGSASAKWAVMAPTFIPMFMLLGVPPEATQAAYRVGDSCGNILTPLLPYFPLVLGYGRQWVPDLKTGTLLSLLVPYGVVFLLCWSLLFVFWWQLGIPFGI